jgi:leader peptidase (prepilin peptidase)/N-methyltransferase
MAGASAFWISPWNLTLYLLFSCTGALLFVLYLYLRGGRIDLKMKVPFGPFLGLGLLVTWVLENSGFPTLVPDGSS